MKQSNKAYKACLYVRVSTHHQIDRDSLPFQKQELANYARYVLNIDNYEIFEDAGYSAKNTDRPRYQDMMERIRKGEFTHLIVWKLDRISRNLKDFTEMWEELQHRGIIFVSKLEQFDTSTAMGEAMLKIILVFAELERKLTAERVMSIMLSRATKGLWNGAPVPLGYKWDTETNTVIIDEAEAQTVKLIYDLYEKTGSSGDVFGHLTLSNINTKRGGKWTTKTIIDILRSPIYKGTLRYNYRKSGRGKKKNAEEWIFVDEAVPAIISAEQWERTQLSIDSNFKGARTKSELSNHTHIFAGLLYCPDCDMNYLASLDRPRNDGYQPSKYRCRNNVQSRKAWRKCSGYVSDITLCVFVFSYLSNFVNASRLLLNNPKIKTEQIERKLLNGEVFSKIAGIEAQGLSDTYDSILNATGELLEQPEYSEASTIDFESERLKQSKQKTERALERLENAFLFDDAAMAEKDFLIKRAELKKNIEEINSKMKDLNVAQSKTSKGIDFIEQASKLLLALNILSGDIDSDIARDRDRDALKEFVNAVIEKIEIKDKKVMAIHFKGGITHRFIHRVLLVR